jgi:subtilisin family serine protease
MKNLILVISFLISFQVFAKETRKRIAVIDTGYNRTRLSNLPINTFCENGLKDVTGTGPQDSLGHGTNIIGLIAKGMDTKKFCIVSIKWYDTNFKVTLNVLVTRIRAAIKLAEQQQPVLINLSSSGSNYDSIEQMIINRLTFKGVKIVVSAGNDGLDLSKSCLIYPACYNANKNNFYVVGSMDKYNNLLDTSNKFGPVSYYENGLNQCSEGICMTGTSQAAAIRSNKLIRGMQ